MTERQLIACASALFADGCLHDELAAALGISEEDAVRLTVIGADLQSNRKMGITHPRPGLMRLSDKAREGLRDPVHDAGMSDWTAAPDAKERDYTPRKPKGKCEPDEPKYEADPKVYPTIPPSLRD